MSASNEQALLELIREQFRGKESHPEYPLWVQRELDLVEKHTTLLLPDIEQFFPLQGRRLLEFGCGTGGSPVSLARAGARVVGVEPDPLSVRIARLRVRNHDVEDRVSVLHLEDTLHLPFLDESFDACICHSVLQLVHAGRERYIREMWRVIRRGGFLYVGGSSNALMPIEMHSGRWLANHIPSLAGKTRGVSYWSILAALRPARFEVMNLTHRPDGLERFIERTAKLEASARKRLARSLLVGFYRVLRGSVCRVTRSPIEAYLPWLDVCIRKV